MNNRKLFAKVGNSFFFLRRVSYRTPTEFHVIRFDVPKFEIKYDGYSKHIYIPSIDGEILRKGFRFNSEAQAKKFLINYLKLQHAKPKVIDGFFNVTG